MKASFTAVLSFIAIVSVVARPKQECIYDDETYAYGQQWKVRTVRMDGNALCKCDFPYYLGYRGQHVTSICRWQGCKVYDGPFYHPGERLIDAYGNACLCVPGPDPYLMDTSTSYHFECEGPNKTFPVEVGP